MKTHFAQGEGDGQFAKLQLNNEIASLKYVLKFISKTAMVMKLTLIWDAVFIVNSIHNHQLIVTNLQLFISLILVKKTI